MTSTADAPSAAGRGAARLRRRALLESLCAALQDYLDALAAQERAIESEDPERLRASTEAAEWFFGNAESVERALAPLEALCRAGGGEGAGAGDAARLRASAAALRLRAREGIARNRALLRARMADTARLIARPRDPFRAERSVYAAAAETARLIAIDA